MLSKKGPFTGVTKYLQITYLIRIWYPGYGKNSQNSASERHHLPSSAPLPVRGMGHSAVSYRLRPQSAAVGNGRTAGVGGGAGTLQPSALLVGCRAAALTAVRTGGRPGVGHRVSVSEALRPHGGRLGRGRGQAHVRHGWALRTRCRVNRGGRESTRAQRQGRSAAAT